MAPMSTPRAARRAESLDRGRIQRQPGQPGDGLGEDLGVGVVLGQALDVVVECIEACGGDDTGLAHGAAQALFPDPGLLDQHCGAGEHAAHRAAEALGEVDPDGIEGPGEVGRGDARGDGGVHQARAVHVEGEPGLPRHLGDRLEGG
jgi:hypothetical protein